MACGQRRMAYIHPQWAIGLRFSGATTKAGDRGSPLVVRAADGKYTLAGMHIGRSAQGYGVMGMAAPERSALSNGDTVYPAIQRLSGKPHHVGWL